MRHRVERQDLWDDTADVTPTLERRPVLIGLLLLVIVVVIVWRLVAPGEQFLSAFAPLLTDSTITRGAFSFFSGRSYLTGKFQGRDVVVRLQLKRGKYGQGYLVLAVRTDGPPALDYDGIETHARDEAGRRALYVLATHDLVLSVEDGWLKALWRPQGFFIFPGRFSEEKWREALDTMRLLATSLEGAAPEVSLERMDGS